LAADGQDPSTSCREPGGACTCNREAVDQLTRHLVDTYGEVVMEDLEIAAMKRSMGR
jgi:transposase